MVKVQRLKALALRVGRGLKRRLKGRRVAAPVAVARRAQPAEPQPERPSGSGEKGRQAYEAAMIARHGDELDLADLKRSLSYLPPLNGYANPFSVAQGERF